MSDQSDSDPMKPASPAALRDTRWLAGAIWGACLVSLVVTSWAGLRSATSPSDLGFLSLLYYGGGNEGLEPDRQLTASAALIITAGIASVLLVAWWALAKATHGLIAALSDSSDSEDDEPVTGIWLAAEGGRSPLSDMASYVGVAWALIVLRPVVVGAIQIFTS